MKLTALVCITMLAFAANSVLTRLGLASAETGPASFVAIRLVSGGVMLAILLALRDRARPAVGRRAVWAAASLLLYAAGFSFAYVSLPTGVGALILFGGVQITMFAASLIRREAIAPLAWAGAALAFGGLCYLLWPGQSQGANPGSAALMIAAALGWGLFSVVGRGERDPLGATALAFVLAAPIAVSIWFVLPDAINPRGAVLACLSGAITSGLGYALWYRVLPHLSGPVAAVAQLSVPVIAAGGGALLLAEPLTARFAIASIAVLGGVGLTVLAARK